MITFTSDDDKKGFIKGLFALYLVAVFKNDIIELIENIFSEKEEVLQN